MTRQGVNITGTEGQVDRNIHANDFKSVVESQAADKTTRQKSLSIKPLGGTKTQMMAHIEPQKSDIREYESIFTQNSKDNEPVYTTN